MNFFSCLLFLRFKREQFSGGGPISGYQQVSGFENLDGDGGGGMGPGGGGYIGEPGSPDSFEEIERPPLRKIDKYTKAECPCLSQRYTIAVMACLGFIISFGMRCNMGMAKLQLEGHVSSTEWKFTGRIQLTLIVAFKSYQTVEIFILFAKLEIFIH